MSGWFACEKLVVESTKKIRNDKMKGLSIA